MAKKNRKPPKANSKRQAHAQLKGYLYQILPGKNSTAQRLIKAMEKPPHLTHEDVEALRQSIEEGKIPIKFDSPLEPDEREKE